MADISFDYSTGWDFYALVPGAPTLEWETRLRPLVRNVELLGEIPITAEECDQMGDAIGLAVKSYGLHKLIELRPIMFAVYLVAQGIHGYKGGDYWTPVVDRTGFKPQQTARLGQIFEQILDALQLPLFYDMRAERAHRYVSRILAHGGIPTYCLGDFFQNMLQPAVSRAEYADMTAAELIEEWRWLARTKYFTDKPVMRFLTYGGRVAEDFLDRCREMAHAYLETGIVPSGEDLGLPERVVDAYGKWAATLDSKQIAREARDQWRLRKPVLQVDPWGEGIFFDLPPQQVPATHIQAEIAWHISFGNRHIYVPVRVRRSGFDWTTVSESARLAQPSERYVAELQVDGETKRVWRFQGIDQDRPLFVFDAQRFAVLAWKLSLPTGCMGFLYPRDCQLKVNRPDSATTEGAPTTSLNQGLLEELPRMPGGWSDYHGQVWELAHGDQVVLSQDGLEIVKAAVRTDEVAKRPFLIGGSIACGDAASMRAPVYIGKPPRVRIPLIGRGTLEEELSRWRLSVQSRWAAAPERDVTRTLSDLRLHLVTRDGSVDLPLGLPRLLGEHPVGTYTIRLRGPLGRSAEFKIRMVSHLVVCGHEQLYLPELGSGHESIELLIETAPGDLLDCRGHTHNDAESIECREQLLEKASDTWEYVLRVPPTVSAVEITVVHPRLKGDPVRVPVYVPIRRLRWAWIDDGEERSRRAFTGETIRLPVEKLLQADSAAMLVSLPSETADAVTMALRLSDVDDQELMIWDVPTPRGHRRMWRVPLAGFVDTIRASTSPVLRFQLLIQGLPEAEELRRWSALTLTRTLGIKGVHAICRAKADKICTMLQWQETAKLRNRVVRLWSLWRPWQPVQEVPIPDDVEGQLRFCLPRADFAPGAYRLQFLTVDPWAPDSNPQMPQEDAPGTRDVALTMPGERLRWLRAEIQNGKPPFPLWLERAYIDRAISDRRGSLNDQERCYQELDGGTVPEVLALHRLMVEMEPESQRKALELRMFAVGRVKHLLKAQAQGHVSEEHFDAYLARLPRSGLLPLGTCQLLLSVADERAQIYALRQLVQRGNSIGPKTVHNWVLDARISDADAVTILKLNTDFSVDYLQEHWRDPVAHRLLEKLSRASGDPTRVIQCGLWVHTDVGWGRIDAISNIDGQPVEDFIRGDNTYRLRATLRPDIHPETVVIDLVKMRVTFTEPGTIYTCTCKGCHGFSSHDPYLISEAHNRAAHNGLGPALRKEKFLFRTIQSLRYSARKPRNDLT